MSNCVKEITAHHTCSNKGGEEFVFNNAPFKSEVKIDYFPFLGEGYYFWDNNLELAKIYGKQRYNGKFLVLEFVLRIDEERMLDLVGNREDILWFKSFSSKIEQLFTELKPNLEEKLGFPVNEQLTVGLVIELMKLINAFEDIDVIKAIDASSAKDKLAFRYSRHDYKSKKEFLNLNPKIFYCYFEWHENFYTFKKVIHTKN